jgi:flavodoxin
MSISGVLSYEMGSKKMNMNTVIVYDSLYGNTEKIAQAMGMANPQESTVIPIHKINSINLDQVKLLIVGSPVHGGRPTPPIEEFIKKLPPHALKNVRVAAFDTRFASRDHGLGIQILMNVIRYAAERITKELTKKGGQLVAEPEGFIVEDKAGPLKEGELERATQWAKQLIN